MKKVRILSIDFDYFQETTENAVKNFYPDGVDLPYQISLMTWTRAYNKLCAGYDEINKVTINEKLLDDALSVIMRQSLSTPIIIRESHIGIWKEIQKRCAADDEIYVAHVDFHHDFDNGNEDYGIVDCGNWLWHLTHLYNAKLRWYTRSVSQSLYGCNGEIPCFKDNLLPLKMEAPFDFVYICRSDPWVPPHLDNYFDKIVKLCQSKFMIVETEECITYPRPMDVIEKSVRIIEESFQNFMEGKE